MAGRTSLRVEHKNFMNKILVGTGDNHSVSLANLIMHSIIAQISKNLTHQ